MLTRRLLSLWLTIPPQVADASPLGQVVEEAKKPIVEQRAVHRESLPPTASPGCCLSEEEAPSSHLDSAFDFLAGIGSLLEFFSTWGEANASPSAAIDANDAAYFNTQTVNPPGPRPALDGQRTPDDIESSMGGEFLHHSVSPPPPHEPAFFVGVTTLSVRPRDRVLAALDGYGVEAGGSVSSRIRVGAGLYRTHGRVRESSPAHSGIENLLETALDLRARFPLLRGSVSRLTGFFGARFARLQWDYVHPVYAVDPWGYGDEIWDDSLYNVSGYGGIGVTPIQTRFWQVVVDFSVGWREYSRESFEGFGNDLFADNWMTQLNIEFKLRF